MSMHPDAASMSAVQGNDAPPSPTLPDDDTKKRKHVDPEEPMLYVRTGGVALEYVDVDLNKVPGVKDMTRVLRVDDQSKLRLDRDGAVALFGPSSPEILFGFSPYFAEFEIDCSRRYGRGVWFVAAPWKKQEKQTMQLWVKARHRAEFAKVEQEVHGQTVDEWETRLFPGAEICATSLGLDKHVLWTVRVSEVRGKRA